MMEDRMRLFPTTAHATPIGAMDLVRETFYRGSDCHEFLDLHMNCIGR